MYMDIYNKLSLMEQSEGGANLMTQRRVYHSIEMEGMREMGERFTQIWVGDTHSLYTMVIDMLRQHMVIDHVT